MGFFSWNCKGCNESIKAPFEVPVDIEWQNDAVLLCEDGSLVCGDYDGYGRIGGADIEFKTSNPELWHKKCWEKAGQPMKYSGPSDYAQDQGFFYDYEGAYEDEI